MKFAALKRFRYHALILVGVLIAYVAADVWWHRTGSSKVSKLYDEVKYDPFAPPPSKRIKDAISAAGNAVFPDFAFKWHQSRSPFRPRNDLNGHPYFPDSFPGGYDYPRDMTSLSGIFRQLGVQSLFRGKGLSDGPDVIRLTLIGFRDSHVNISLNKQTDRSVKATYAICESWNRMDIESGPEPKRKSGSTRSSPNAWTEIETLMSSPAFWTDWKDSERPFFDKDFPGPQMLFDSGLENSATWIFEFRSGSSYRIIKIRDPIGFIELCATHPELVKGVRDLKPYVKIGQIISDEVTFPLSHHGDLSWPQWPDDHRKPQ